MRNWGPEEQHNLPKITQKNEELNQAPTGSDALIPHPILFPLTSALQDGF